MSRFARSIASVIDGEKAQRGSGFLISPNLVVTARHALHRDDGGDPNLLDSDETALVFAQDDSAELEELERRLVQLALFSEQASDFQVVEPGRMGIVDDLYEVNESDVVVLGVADFGIKATVPGHPSQLPPGVLFDTLPLESEAKWFQSPDNPHFDVWALQDVGGDRWVSPPGPSNFDLAECEPRDSTQFDSVCFGADVSAVAPSAGGPAVYFRYASRPRIVGVLQSYPKAPDEATFPGVRAASDGSDSDAYAISHVAPLVPYSSSGGDPVPTDTEYPKDPGAPNSRSGPCVGDCDDIRYWMCADAHQEPNVGHPPAVGLLGARDVEDARGVGALGAVCSRNPSLPYTEEWEQLRVMGRPRHRLGTIGLSAPSAGTPLIQALQQSFVQVADDLREPLALQMCPPGYVMTGVDLAMDGAEIVGFDALHCQRRLTQGGARRVTVSLSQDARFVQRIGTPNARATRTLQCAPGEVVVGFGEDPKQEAQLSAFQLVCAPFDSMERLDPIEGGAGPVGDACAENSDCSGTEECIDGAPYGFPRGVCAELCESDSECGSGERCTLRTRFAPNLGQEQRPNLDQRFAQSGATRPVCVPSVAPACAEDDAIVPVLYPGDDLGRLWVPREAACDPSVERDLVIQLHGNNPANARFSMLEDPESRRVELLLRALIDHSGMDPILFAEPIDFRNGTDPWTRNWDMLEYLAALSEVIADERLRVNSISFVGHSAAGCENDGGLRWVARHLDEIEEAMDTRVRFVGSEDTCLSGSTTAFMSGFDPRPDITLGVLRVTQDPLDRTDPFDAWFFGDESLPMSAAPELFGTRGHGSRRARPGRRHRTLSRCEYLAPRPPGSGPSPHITHGSAHYYFIREMFPRVFRPLSTACQ